MPLTTAPYLTTDFDQAAQTLAQTSRELYARGWSPATSSNYSQRLSPSACAITTSGQNKATLTPGDIMAVDLAGQALSPGKPSAETLLHTWLYQRFDGTDGKIFVGAVLHTHSPQATLLSRLLQGQNQLQLQDYELLKAFSGIRTHATQIILPIFENTQDIAQLAADVDQYLAAHPQTYGYLIRGHGLYTWGKDMAETCRHLEAWEFLLDCELEQIKLGRG